VVEEMLRELSWCDAIQGCEFGQDGAERTGVITARIRIIHERHVSDVEALGLQRGNDLRPVEVVQILGILRCRAAPGQLDGIKKVIAVDVIPGNETDIGNAGNQEVFDAY
jgi:hypothetical protein